jgi:hypothetical protein
MDEAPRNTGNAGKGRKKGVPNKTTGLLKDMILAAMNEAGGKGGGQAYLVLQAKEQPVAFMTLLGKVLPTQIHGSGEDGELIHKVVREIVRPAHTDS